VFRQPVLLRRRCETERAAPDRATGHEARGARAACRFEGGREGVAVDLAATEQRLTKWRRGFGEARAGGEVAGILELQEVGSRTREIGCASHDEVGEGGRVGILALPDAQ